MDHGHEHLVELEGRASLHALEEQERCKERGVIVFVQVVLKDWLRYQHSKNKDDHSAGCKVSQLFAYL